MKHKKKIIRIVFFLLLFFPLFLFSLEKSLAAGEECATGEINGKTIKGTCQQTSFMMCPSGYTHVSRANTTNLSYTGPASTGCGSGETCCFSNSDLESTTQCAQMQGTCRAINTESGSTCDENTEDYKGPGLGCPMGEGCCAPKANQNPANPTNSNNSNSNPSGSPTAARTGSTGGLVPCTDDCTLCHLVIGFKNIYDYLLYTILFPATILGIVISGILYMVSSGSKTLIEKAKTAFVYSLTAMILALLAWLIINATLHALGYNNVGNWYTFTCDTTQTQGPTGGGGAGSTGTGNTGPVGSGCTGIVQNAKNKMNAGWQYSKPLRGQCVNGVCYTDCSHFASTSYKEAGCSSPGNTTTEMYPKAQNIGNKNDLRPGDLLIYPGHVVICEDNGCNTIIHAANPQKDIVESNASWVFNMSGVKVLRASDFCSSCFLINRKTICLR